MIIHVCIAALLLTGIFVSQRRVALSISIVGGILAMMYSITPFGFEFLVFIATVFFGRLLLRYFDASTMASQCAVTIMSILMYATLKSIIWFLLYRPDMSSVFLQGALFGARYISTAFFLWVALRGLIFGVSLMRYAVVEEKFST